MTASGPFAMGPALASTSARRSTPKSSFTPIVPQGAAKGSALGANLLNVAAPTLRKDKQRENPLVDPAIDKPPKNESDEEVYSEPDEGVEIIDMDNVRQLDWMAPETLQRDRRDRAKRRRIKTEVEELSVPHVSQGSLSSLLLPIPNCIIGFIGPSEDVDPSNALDLSESEEDELEDLMEDFAFQANIAEVRTLTGIMNTEYQTSPGGYSTRAVILFPIP